MSKASEIANKHLPEISGWMGAGSYSFQTIVKLQPEICRDAINCVSTEALQLLPAINFLRIWLT
jgi:hypothetical protein